MVNLNNFLGMEAISFQTHSQLGKDLTALFQEVIDYRNNLDYKNIPDSFYERRTYRIWNVLDYVKKTMAPKFVKILEKDLGFKVKRFAVYGSSDDTVPPTGLFAVSIDINAMGPDMYKAIMNMSGTNYGDTNLTNRYANDVRELAECIDLSSGTLKKTTIGNNVPITVQVIYFDALMAFCFSDYVEETYAKEFTAEELAAIMMHECGHAMTVIEHAADLYVTNSRIRNDAVNIKKSGDIEAASKFIKELDTKVITEIVAIVNATDFEQFGDVKPLKKAVLKAATMVGKLGKVMKVAEKDKGEGTLWMGLGWLPFNILFAFVHLILLITTDIALLVMQATTINNLVQYCGYVDEHGDKGKAADRRNNKNSLFLLERWADEFVAKQGYGEHLSSGLNKLMAAFNYLYNSGVHTTGMYHDRSVNDITLYNGAVSMYLWICDKISLTNYFDPIVYENNYNRLKRILQNTKSIFKEEKLPDDCVYEWLNKCKNIEIEMQKAKRITDTPFVKAALNLLNNLYVLDAVNLWQLIKDGKLDRDCSILEDRIDDMRNNSLFMLSHRFGTM